MFYKYQQSEEYKQSQWAQYECKFPSDVTQLLPKSSNLRISSVFKLHVQYMYLKYFIFVDLKSSLSYTNIKVLCLSSQRNVSTLHFSIHIWFLVWGHFCTFYYISHILTSICNTIQVFLALCSLIWRLFNDWILKRIRPKNLVFANILEKR